MSDWQAELIVRLLGFVAVLVGTTVLGVHNQPALAAMVFLVGGAAVWFAGSGEE